MSSNGGSNRSYPQVPTDARAYQRDSIEEPNEQDDGPLDILIGFVSGLAALVCIFGALTILTVLYVTVRPFSRPLYRRLAAQLGEGSFLDAMAILLPNTRLCLTGDSDVPSPVGTSVLVSNHLIDGDWWAALMLGRCIGLRGSVKFFLRKELVEMNSYCRSNSDRSVERSIAVAARNEMNAGEQLTATKTVTFQRSTSNGGAKAFGSPQLSLAGKLLHLLLDFPVLSGENNKDYVSDRAELFEMLRSFAENNGNAAPVHLMLYPEVWSLHDQSLVDRKVILAKSNEFAKREGRPQLKYLLLPRTTGFNASLESLRASSPVVYDVTMAYVGYDGSLPPSLDLSLPTIWRILRKQYPTEVHIRVKRYSMEEVLQDPMWLDKQWAEKDKLLGHFIRHQAFPTDNRGFCRHRVFDTRHHSIEGSVLALVRLLLMPCAIPFLLLISIPLFWIVLWSWIVFRLFKLLFPDEPPSESSNADAENNTSQTPGSAGLDSATGTPFFPATPFASPSITNWRDLIGNNSYGNGDSPVG